MRASTWILILAICVFEVLRLSPGNGSRYGRTCDTDAYCKRATDDSARCVDPLTACFKREINDSVTGTYRTFKNCPFTINTTRNLPQRACVGVPEAVQNVQVNVTRSPDKKKLTVTVTWSPSPKYVGPLVYFVDLIGDDHAPTNPAFITFGQTDEETFNYRFENASGNLNYTVNVTAVTAVGQSGLHAPFRITDTKPQLPSNEQLMSPHHDASTSFDMRLCSSCLVDPNLGLVEAIVIVVCDTRKSSKCQHSYVDPDNRPSNIRITQAEDIKLFSTWAMAKSSDFEVPYRATPDDFHQMLKQERSAEIIYTVGGNYCDESNNQSFCNGPVPQGSEFIVTVIVCNDLGCDESPSSPERFTTDSDNDDDDDIIIALAVLLGIAVLICILMAIYIVCSKRSAIV